MDDLIALAKGTDKEIVGYYKAERDCRFSN